MVRPRGRTPRFGGRLSRSGREPSDVGRAHARAAWVAFGVCEANPSNQLRVCARGLIDQRRIDAVEPELRPSEQPEGPIIWDLAPGQPDVAVTQLAPDKGAAEVEVAGMPPDRDVQLPARVFCISRHDAGHSPGPGRNKGQLGRSRLSDAQAHMNVLAPAAGRIWLAA